MATSCFEIAFETQADLELFDGDGTEVQFTVTNRFTEFRNVAFRVAVMNSIGQENPGADERGWFKVAAPPDPLLQAGAEMGCTVHVVVPKDTGKRKIVWALVAYDKDLGDEPRFFSQPLSLDVKNVVVEPPPPVETKIIPWWVWLIVGLAVVGIIAAVIIGVTADDGPEVPEPSITVLEVQGPEKFDLGVLVFDAEQPNPVLSSASVQLALVVPGGSTGHSKLGETSLNRQFETIPVAQGTTNASGEAWFEVCKRADSLKFAEKYAGLTHTRIAAEARKYTCIPVSGSMALKVTRSGYQASVVRRVSAEELQDQPKTVAFPLTKSGGVIVDFPWPEIYDHIDLNDYQIKYLGDEQLEEVRTHPELMLGTDEAMIRTNMVVPGLDIHRLQTPGPAEERLMTPVPVERRKVDGPSKMKETR